LNYFFVGGGPQGSIGLTVEGAARLPAHTNGVLVTKVDGHVVWSVSPEEHNLVPRLPIADGIEWRDNGTLWLSPGRHEIQAVRYQDVGQAYDSSLFWDRPDLTCLIAFQADAASEYALTRHGKDSVRLERRQRRGTAPTARCLPPPKREGVALLRIRTSDIQVYLNSVDGWMPKVGLSGQNQTRAMRNPFPAPNGMTWSGDGFLDLPPGVHHLVVNYRSGSFYALMPCSLAFTAIAAHVYELKANATGGNPFARTGWQGRVEDMQTKSIAGSCGK
jgi:hypothetical protein